MKQLKYPFIINNKLAVYVLIHEDNSMFESYQLFDSNKKSITSLVGTVNSNSYYK